MRLAGTSPNILSELTWSDVQMVELRGAADYLMNRSVLKGVYLEGSFSIAKALAGDNQDSDYLSDNRVDEFSRSNNDAGDSSAQGYSIGLGYQFDVIKNPESSVFLTPIIGYESSIITLKMTDGFQTVDTIAPVTLGAFDGLNSKYEAEWSSAFLGLKLGGRFGNHAVGLRGDYFMGDYYAEADWNLRSDFQHPKSYTHEADSTGFALKANYAYSLRRDLALFLDASLRTFEAEDGRDTTFLAPSGIGVTKLNEVNWTSSQFHAGVKYSF
jgi:hypothetical protein